MNSRRCALVAGAAVLLMVYAQGKTAHAKPNAESGVAEADARILKEVSENSEAMHNAEYLSDRIGPRLTGSAQLKQANEWTAEVMRKYGLSNVHLEPWTIAHGWTRGTATARIIAPAEHPLTIAAAGWSPGTRGKVRGPVVYFDARNKADFARFHGQLKDAMVIYQEPGKPFA